MRDALYDYMSKRLSDHEISQLKTKPGPVVTISRQAGCSTQKMAQALAQKLNSLTKDQKWGVISKEVLYESAQKLQLDPKQIKKVFKIQDRSVLEDIMQAFLSKDYHLERKMRNTVIKVIQQFAIEGHKIIIGRGANSICGDIQDSLHLRIVAPLEWRVEKVMKNRAFNKEEAHACIRKTENDRNKFRHSIKGNINACTEYDLTINQSKYTNNEIIDIVVAALKSKKII